MTKTHIMSTNIYIIRHSETDYNLEHRHNHEGKAMLTPAGTERAEKIAQLFRDTPISAIYSSPLQRCVDTITPTAKSANIPMYQDDRLTESYF